MTQNRTKSVLFFSGNCLLVVENSMSHEVRKVAKKKLHKVRR